MGILWAQLAAARGDVPVGLLVVGGIVLLLLTWRLEMERAKHPRPEIKVTVDTRESERETYILVPEALVRPPQSLVGDEEVRSHSRREEQ